MQQLEGMLSAIINLKHKFHDLQTTVISREKMELMKLPDMARTLKQLRVLVDTADELTKQISEVHETLAVNIIPDAMGEDIQTIKIKDVGRLQVRYDIHCSVKADKKDDLKKWLLENGHGALIMDQVNSSTLKAFVKEQIEQGAPYPEDCLSIHSYSKASVVKA